MAAWALRWTDKLNLGDDVTAAAGPMGRTASAKTSAPMRAEIRTDGRNSRPVCRRRVEWGPITADADAIEDLDGRKIDLRKVLVDANAGNTRTSKENESRSCPEPDPEPSGVGRDSQSGDRHSCQSSVAQRAAPFSTGKAMSEEY